MKDINEEPSVITADLALFDFLQEKTGERKTRTEAYCDLLDKASTGYVSPFVKKSDVVLKPRQCHVTITDLADQWKWHRATIRSFLERLEKLGQLETDKQPKSIVITMPCDANLIRPNNGTPEERFAVEFSQLLSVWTNGSITSRDTSKRIEQCLQEATQDAANSQNAECAQSSEASFHMLSEKIRHDALAMVAATVFRQVLQNGVSGNEAEVASPLDDFFTIDLCGDWASFMDVTRMLSEIVVNGDAPVMIDQSAANKSALMPLRQPFLAMLAEQVGGHSAQRLAIRQQ